MKKKIEKVEVVTETLDLGWQGVYDLKSFTKMLEDAFKQANQQHHNILTRYDFYFDKEWDYDNEYTFRLKMRVFRLENDEELKHRLYWENKRKEELKKQELKEKEAERKRKQKQELRAKDSEYQKYQELQKSLKKRKVI